MKTKYNLSLATLALVTLLLAVAPSARADTVTPSAGVTTGWLEGTLVNDQNLTVSSWSYSAGGTVHVHGERDGGGNFEVEADATMGGLYVAKGIRPGIYTLSVRETWSKNKPNCPIRIFSVVVKPDVRPVLHIVLQGETLQEVGKPTVDTTQGVVVSLELDKLRAELAALSKQVEDLRAQVAAVTPGGATAPAGGTAKP